MVSLKEFVVAQISEILGRAALTINPLEIVELDSKSSIYIKELEEHMNDKTVIVQIPSHNESGRMKLMEFPAYAFAVHEILSIMRGVESPKLPTFMDGLLVGEP